MRKLQQKLDGYRRKGLHEWSMSRYRAEKRRKQKAFDDWLRRLQQSPPQVLVGPNFAKFGGVKHHIEAIVRHSALSVELFPPVPVADTISAYDLATTFHDRITHCQLEGVRVVHSHVFPWFVDWCHDRQRKGFRWVHTYHLNYYPEHSRSGVLEPMQHEINDALLHIAHKANIRLSVSRWQADELLTKHGIETVYLPNGVDVSWSDRANAQRFRRQHRVAGDFILYVGRDDPVKNPGEFVRLAHRMPEYQFVMVGAGLNSNSISEIYGLQAPDNLLFLGPISQQSVQDGIAACQVLVVTSKREGLPTLVLEGMALAKPIVVPDEIGCSEAIGHGEAGRIYELGNLDDLTEKTIAAIEGEPVCQAARDRVEREYDWRIVSNMLDAIYRES